MVNMAVIIDMDMPNGCIECPLFADVFNSCPFGHIDDASHRLDNCPLKSTDEMIAEIKNIKTIGNTWELAVKEEVIDILNKYCDKEHNDA